MTSLLFIDAKARAAKIRTCTFEPVYEPVENVFAVITSARTRAVSRSTVRSPRNLRLCVRTTTTTKASFHRCCLVVTTAVVASRAVVIGSIATFFTTVCVRTCLLLLLLFRRFNGCIGQAPVYKGSEGVHCESCPSIRYFVQ